jgi:hypothetical protein
MKHGLRVRFSHRSARTSLGAQVRMDPWGQLESKDRKAQWAMSVYTDLEVPAGATGPEGPQGGPGAPGATGPVGPRGQGSPPFRIRSAFAPISWLNST